MSKGSYFISSLPTASKVGLTLFLMGAGLLLGLYSVRATTSQAQQNQSGSSTVSYDCDTAGVITVTRQGSSDRYTYDAVNNRGETIRISNGTSYTAGTTRVYTFATGDTRFLIEDQGNGRATLSTSQGGDNYTNFNCTVTSNNSGSPSSPALPALW
ncbi:hypothetical protein H6F89_03985 [Cyanobacteria bacterium FACHB-63]|nr:hypothetical protein [Cyanobacteria bacterium FACHB-63]